MKKQLLLAIAFAFVFFQTQAQVQPLLRLGSVSNRNMMPLLITGNKSCRTCGGK